MIRGIDDVVLLDILNPFKALKKIRENKFDVFIDLGQWTRLTAILTCLSNSSCTIGFKTHRQYRHYGFDISVEHSFKRHELNNFKALFRQVDVDKSNLPSLDIEFLLGQPLPINRNQVIIHTKPGGSRADLKEWPDEHWKTVIDYLTNKNYEIYLTCVPIQQESLESLKRLCLNQNKIHIVNDSLLNTAKLLISSFLVISVDTGIMHLASALKCNLISLHGPTSFLRWGPLNDNAITIQSSYECPPCLNLGFESTCAKMGCGCMRAISVDEVISKVQEFERKAT